MPLPNHQEASLIVRDNGAVRSVEWDRDLSVNTEICVIRGNQLLIPEPDVQQIPVLLTDVLLVLPRGSLSNAGDKISQAVQYGRDTQQAYKAVAKAVAVIAYEQWDLRNGIVPSVLVLPIGADATADKQGEEEIDILGKARGAFLPQTEYLKAAEERYLRHEVTIDIQCISNLTKLLVELNSNYSPTRRLKKQDRQLLLLVDQIIDTLYDPDYGFAYQIDNTIRNLAVTNLNVQLERQGIQIIEYVSGDGNPRVVLNFPHQQAARRLRKLLAF